MAEYLIYWKPETVIRNQERNHCIFHTASNQYAKVNVGDRLWIVTSEAVDDLVLVGRQRIDRILSQSQANALFPGEPVWKARFHAICDKPEEIIALDISAWARRLSFDGSVEYLPKGFTGQHLQTMRRLTGEAVNELEKLWARHHEAE